MFCKLKKWGELYFFSLLLHPVYSVGIQTKKWPFKREFSKCEYSPNHSLFASIAFAKKPYCKFDFFEKNMTCLAKLSRVVSLCYKHITAVKFMNSLHRQMSVFTGEKATFKCVRQIQGHYRQFYRFTDECPWTKRFCRKYGLLTVNCMFIIQKWESTDICPWNLCL